MNYITATKKTVLSCILLGFTASLFAASVELWPAERRRNQTQYCYGGDWNALSILLVSDDYNGAISNCKYKFETPKSFAEETVLEVTLPKSAEFLGVYQPGDSGIVKDFETTNIAKDGKEYTRIRIPLNNEVLNKRIRNAYYDMFVWYKPPEQLDDMLQWKLTYGPKVITDSTLRLRTAGVVREGRKFPRRFGFYPYGPSHAVPNDNFDKMAEFYKRLGVTGFETHWSNGLPRDDGKVHPMLEANRRHGIKNIANMAYFCQKHGKNMAMASGHAIRKTSGLTEAMDIACKGLESEEAKQDWTKAAPNFDMALYDWEPSGPREWPGYNEPATIAAFAKARGITESLTPELIRTKYRQDYARYRMEQTARPLYSLTKTINAVKPMPFFAEQGSGLARNIDYDVYGNDFDYVRPMIYKPSPLSYARDMIEMLECTSVPAKKFVPDLTVGWPQSGPHRETPEEFLLDMIVSAAAGCGSIAHWGGPHRSDATWFGIHEGLARIAMVEDFYFDGKPMETISIKGIPYCTKKIDIGDKTIEFHGPDWRPVLLNFAHQLNNEYLLTILNYHKDEDAFVEIKSPSLSKYYLTDPVNKVYYICDDTGRTVVRVKKETPDLWIATKDKNRIAGYKQIDANTVESQFKTARENYLKTNKAGNVKLGKVSDIDIAYDQVEFGGDKRICLRVSTPTQSLYFGDSGGRIYDWTVKDMPAFIGKKTYTTDGFGMDLLWLPENARFSGDESQTMTLVKCENNGKEARIAYTGEFRSGLTGVKIEKEYVVPAAGSSLDVTITLRNERAGPVMLSYWQHNVLGPTHIQFLPGPQKPICEKTGTSIFPAEGLPDEIRPHVFSPRDIVGTTDGEYAEYFPETKSGLIFRLPKDFMNVYRWISLGHNVSGSEWMSQPMTLSAGGSKTLQYSITAVPNTTVDKMRKQIE